MGIGEFPLSLYILRKVVIWITRKVKCPECGTYNDKENTIYHNAKYYCKICFENKQKESQDYKDLIAYVCELYQIEVPNGLMFKQIKDFKEQFNYTYRGMKTTLHYFYEIQEGNSVEDSVGIGIIPFVYDEAKKFYIDKKAIKDSVIGCNMEELQEKNKTIKINKKAYQSNNNKYKDITLIDIEKL
jgi:hypothetical protein